MATLTEKPESRAYNTDGSITLVYNYRDAGSDTAAAYAALIAALPETSDDMVREPFPTMAPIYVDESAGDGDYEVTCRYLPVEKQRQASGEIQVRISTVSASKHITQAYAHIASYGTNPPNHKGAIGVTKDGPQGTDVQDPLIAMTVLRRYPVASLPATSTLTALRGKVNEDQVTITDTRKDRTWTVPVGELLCEGFEEGLLASDGLVDVTYNFLASPNLTDLTVGDLTGIAKKGHEHLWIEYAEKRDGTGNRIAVPQFAHVDQIYPTTNMNGLGLGGA